MARQQKRENKSEASSTQRSHTQQLGKGGLILPHVIKYGDIIALIDYLKKKPLGATQVEIKTALGAEVLDWRKIEGYKMTGFFNFNETVKLSATGVEFSQANEDGKREMVWQILKTVRPYNGVLEWAYYQKKRQLDAGGIRLKWSTEYPEIDKSNKQRFDQAPISFFSLCDGAGLGKLLIGRKGQPTRVELDVTNLNAYVSHAGVVGMESHALQPSPHGSQESAVAALEEPAPAKVGTLPRNVFISHGKTKGPLTDVEEMLRIMGLEPKITVREANLARPVSEKVRTTMKECSAAVFIFTPDETLTDADGKKVYKPSENVLHELGAASVLYDDRVVILKERTIQLPSNVSGLAHIPFDIGSVKATFMDLYKELKGFGLLS
jgi:predicted nucleotide-binding protein